VKFKQTPFINLEGDFNGAKALIPKALRELDILNDLMNFQKLEQGTRVVNFDTGEQISLRQTFGVTNIYIYSPEVVEEVIIEEITGVFILRLTQRLSGGSVVSVTEDTLMYLAFYPAGSTEYNRYGPDDENQPSYLYDPESMYRRTVDGFYDPEPWGVEADTKPTFTGNDILIPTSFIKSYVSGMSYWISYSTGFLPLTIRTQYPSRINAVDKWQDEDLVVANMGVLEDEVATGMFLQSKLDKWYVHTDVVLDEPAIFPFDQLEVATSLVLTTVLPGVCSIDKDILTAEEEEYFLKVIGTPSGYLSNHINQEVDPDVVNYPWYNSDTDPETWDDLIAEDGGLRSIIIPGFVNNYTAPFEYDYKQHGGPRHRSAYGTVNGHTLVREDHTYDYLFTWDDADPFWFFHENEYVDITETLEYHNIILPFITSTTLTTYTKTSNLHIYYTGEPSSVDRQKHEVKTFSYDYPGYKPLGFIYGESTLVGKRVYISYACPAATNITGEDIKVYDAWGQIIQNSSASTTVLLHHDFELAMRRNNYVQDLFEDIELIDISEDIVKKFGQSYIDIVMNNDSSKSFNINFSIL